MARHPIQTAPARRLKRRGPAPLALEQRFVFDGAAAADAAHAAEPIHDAAITDPSAPTFAAPSATAPAAEAAAREVAFVDTRVPGWQSLIGGIRSGVDIVLVEAGQNGIDRMLATLQGRQDIAAIHIVGHGAAGVATLGDSLLSADGLESLQGQLAAIGASLGADGDILLYGCDIAASPAGQDLIARLAAFTGADVAASTDATGAASRGGNWTLEAATGAIEAPGLLTAAGAAGYDGLLAASSVSSISLSSNAGADGAYKAGDVVTASVVFTQTETVTGSPTLTLNVGDVNRTATYAGGTGTNTLTFNYTIQAGDTDTNGISIAANAITLNGGTIKNGSTNATLNNLALTDQSGHKVDTTPPTTSLAGIVVDLAASSDSGVSDTDNQTEVVKPTVTVDLTGITGLTAGDQIRIIDANNGDAVVGTYTVLAADLTGGNWNRGTQDITLGKLTYGTHNLKAQLSDAAGNTSAASTTPLAVQIIDTTAPSLTAAAAAGSTLTLSFAETNSGLKSTTLAAGDFTVTRNGGTSVTVTGVAIDTTNQVVTLSLGANIATNDTDVRVSYTPPDTANDLQDVAGNKVAAIVNRYVSTSTPVFNVNAQRLEFDDLTMKVGTGKNAGDVGLFNNVITVNGQAIDVIVTTVAVANVTINKYDSATTTVDSKFFELDLKTTAANGYAQFRFDFIKHDTYDAATKTGVAVILQNVALNSYDIDAAGSGQYQFQEFGGFATYTVASNTALTQTNLAQNFVHFQNNDGVNGTFNATIAANGDATADKYRVMALYDAISSFEIKTGVAAKDSTAYFYLDFSKGADFASPKTYTQPTVNPATTADQTPTLTGAYSTSVTNAPTVSVSNVSVTVGGTTYTTANGLSYSGGNWSLTTNTLANGTYDVVVEVTYSDNAVVRDSTSSELVIDTALVVDTTAPTLTSIARMNPSDQGLTASDLEVQDYVDFVVTFSESVTRNITTDDFAIVGAGGTGALISGISQIDTAAYIVRVSGIDSANLGAIGLDLAATQNLVDAAGNRLTDLDPTSGIDQTYVISALADSTAPAAPSVDLLAGSDTGKSSTDDITSEATPTLRVTLNGSGASAPVTGDVVKLYDGATEVGTATLTDADIIAGYVDITSSARSPGSLSFSATVTDAASNVSASSPALAVTLDTTAPTITDPGTPTINENTTAVHTFTANEAVTWSLAGGADQAKFAIDASGNLAFTSAPDYEAPTDAGDTAGNNTYVVTVRATDTAGNTKDQTVTVTVANVDEVAPAFTSGTTANANDGQNLLYTTAATDTVDYTNQVVSYSLKSGTGDFASLAINATTGAVTLASGNLDASTKNSYSFTVIATDATGNFSERAVTVNVTALPAPTIAIDTIAGDDRINATEHGGSVTISGTTTNVEDGRTVTVTLNGQNYTATVSGNAWTLNVQEDKVDALANGSNYQVTADVSNAASIAATQATRNVGVDTAVVRGPLDITTPTDTGANDLVTGHGLPVLTFTGEAGLTISLSGPDSTVLTEDTHYSVSYNGGTGTYTVTLLDAVPSSGGANDPFGTYASGSTTGNPAATADGTYTLTATDTAGNSDTVGSFVIDTTAPAIATATASGTTLVLTYTETGSGFTGTTPDTDDFAVTVNGSAVGVTNVAVNAANKTVTLTLATAVASSDVVTVSYTADTNKIQDVAGNVAANLAGQAVAIVPSQIVVITSVTDDMAPQTGTVAHTGHTNDTAPALAGTLSASLSGGEVLAVYRDGVKIGAATVTGTDWTYADTGLSDGNTYSYTARVEKDGLQGAASDAYAITVDTTLPAGLGSLDITTPTDTGADDLITGHGHPVLTFTGEAGLTISLSGPDGTVLTEGTHYSISYNGGTSTYTVTLLDAVPGSGGADPFGTYASGSATGNPLATADGTYTLKATDAAGNSATVGSFVIDTAAPTAGLGPLDITTPTDTGADDLATGHNNPVLTFPGEAGLTIALSGPDSTVLTKDTHYSVSYDGGTGTYTVTLLDAVPGGSADPFGTYASGSATGNPLATADGTYTLTATDTAGNSAPVGSFVIDTTAPAVTAGQSFDYAENRTTNAVVATVAASDNIAVTGFRFSASGTATSADGYYTIASDGKISITAAGAAAGVAQNDFEIAPNSFTYGIQAGDAAGNWSAAANITLNVTDVSETPPPTIAIAPIAGDDWINALEHGSAVAIGGTTTGAENGRTVTVHLNGQTYTATVNDNAWSLNVPAGDVGALAHGSAYGVTADVSNLANTPASQANRTVTVDTLPPAGLGPLDITAPTDTGANDLATGHSNPVLTFPGEPGLSIALAGPDGTPLVQGTHYSVSHAGGVYTVTLIDAVPGGGANPFGTYAGGSATGNPAATADGTYTLKATDPAGNKSPVGSFVIDTTVPALASAAVNGTTLVLTYDETGSGFAGIAPNASNYAVTANGNPVGVTQVAVDPVNHTVTLTLATPVINTDTVRVSYTAGADKVQDAAGNPAANLVNQPVVNSTGAVPVITRVVDDVAPRTGVVDHEGRTNDTAPEIAGTLNAPLGSGEVLGVYRDGVKIGNATVSGTDWTYADSGLVNGATYAYTARVEKGGLQGMASNVYAITVDTVPPAGLGPLDITAPTDTGADDLATGHNNPVLTFPGEPGLTIVLAGPDGSVLTPDVHYGVSYGGGVYTVTLIDAVPGGGANPFGTHAGGAATGNPAATADGTYTLTAADAAGNQAPVGSFVIDTVAPAIAPGQSFDYPENRTAGTVVATVAASDNLAVTGFRFSATGTATSADGCYTIAGDGRISLTAAGAAAGVAQNDFEIAPNAFAYGIQARDATGNWSAVVDVALNVTDVPEPLSIAIDPIAGDDWINALEHGGALAIGGTTTGVENGRTVTVHLNGHAYTATVNGNAWSLTVPAGDVGALAHGATYAVTADVSTLAGKPAPQAVRPVAVDIVRPTDVAVVSIGDDTDDAGDFRTRDQTLVIGGSFDAADTRTLTVSFNGTTYTVGDGHLSTSGNTWTLDATHQTLTGGSYAVVATATDAAGNATSASRVVVIDMAPPLLAQPPEPAVVAPVPVVPANVPDAGPAATGAPPAGLPESIQGLPSGPLAEELRGIGDNRPLAGAFTSDGDRALRILVIKAEEPALFRFLGVPDQVFDAGGSVRFRLPADAFMHTREDAVVRVYAERTDGGPLPSWLRFDATSGTFEGTAPEDGPEEIPVRITARDTDGREASTIFRIKLLNKEGQQARDSQQTAPGRAGLSEQIRDRADRAGFGRAHRLAGGAEPLKRAA